MVERIMRNPDAAPITEAQAEVEPAPMPQRGLCMICGEWVDAGEGEDLYAVRLTRTDGDVSEHVAHVGCMARAAHPCARLPGAGSHAVPENYLASKPRTPSGR